MPAKGLNAIKNQTCFFLNKTYLSVSKEWVAGKEAGLH